MPTPTTYARSMAHKAQDKWLNGPGGHHAALVAVEEVVNVVIERCAKAVEKGLSAGTDGLHVENDTALALASRRIRALGAAPAAPAAPPGSAATPTKCRVCHLPCVNPAECAKADRCLAGRGSFIAPDRAAKGPTK